MSIRTSGFVRGCTASACRIGYGQRVAERTRSASISSTATASKGAARPPTRSASSRALSSVRLATTTSAPRRLQAPRRELAHLPRAEQQRALALEPAERLRGQLDRRGRDRLRHLREPGLGADALARVEGVLEEPVQHRAGGTGRERGLVGLAHLPEDLSLARDERVEARRDPEEVLDRLVALPDGEHAPRSSPERRSSAARAAAASPTEQIDLGAVAGREHDAAELLGELDLPAVREVELLAHLERRMPVGHADGEQALGFMRKRNHPGTGGRCYRTTACRASRY